MNPLDLLLPAPPTPHPSKEEQANRTPSQVAAAVDVPVRAVVDFGEEVVLPRSAVRQEVRFDQAGRE